MALAAALTQASGEQVEPEALPFNAITLSDDELQFATGGRSYTCALTTGVDVVVPNGGNNSPDQFNARLYGSVRQLRDGTFMM